MCAGGLLYLESFKIDVEDASSEIATAALRQLLLTRLEGAWGLCVYIPEAMPHLTPSEQASVEGERELQIAEIMGMEVPREAPNEDRARMMRRALRRDATPFLRCGFAQADELLLRDGQCTFLFASPPALASPPASHEAATAICLSVPKAAVVLSVVDSELREYCVSLYNRDRYQVASVVAPDADFAARLGGFIARGASVKGAGCVHCAAATDHLEHLELLCALGGPETIKALDNNSHTPLMVAAGAVLGKSSRFTPPSTKTIVTLLSKGADKTIVNDLGRTALGIFWGTRLNLREASVHIVEDVCFTSFRSLHIFYTSSLGARIKSLVFVSSLSTRTQHTGTVKSSNDFEHTFGIPVEDRHCYDMEGICATIEALLMPPAGPTDADLANKDDSDDDD